MKSFAWRVVLALLAAVALRAAVASQSPPAGPADEVTLRIIVVSTSGEAQRVVERLKDGENFALLARSVSIDPSASQGGLVGRIAVSSLRQELRAALAGLPPNQISAIVPMPLGFAVLETLPDAAAVARANPNGYPALDATGAVRYALDAGGLAEAETSLDRFPLPEKWNLDPKTICSVRTQAFDSMHRALETFLSPANGTLASETPADLSQAQYGLGQLDLYQGNMPPAIERFEKAYRLASGAKLATVPDMVESLGIAHFHKAQIDSGVFREPGDQCLLPMRPGRAFAKTADVQKAIDYYAQYLRLRPDDLEARWLLNLAYMALGKYPSGVPSMFLIPAAALASAEDVGRFADAASRAGLNSFQMSGGVIVDDLENNGRFDVVTSSFDACTPMKFFHNNGDGTFSDRTAQAGLSEQLGGLNIVQTDYNNDGCVDILVLRGGWEVAQRKSLLRNNCNGTFTDVTVAAGLAAPTSTQTAVWTDINNDGFLDLFVGNEDGPAQLFLNKGNGTFEDIAHAAGVDRNVVAKGVTAGDFDNDGWPDLFISNLTGNSVLFHNNHDNTFTDVSSAAGVPGADRSFATWFFDYDNDGWPDLFAANYFVSVDETVRTYLNLPHNATPMRLYRNLGNGTFADVTKNVGLDKVFMTMGAGFGDIDNDGFPDIYLGSGSPAYTSLLHAVLLHNKGGRTFTDVSASSGTGEMHKGHGVAFADLDNDGDEDLIFVVGGATPGDAHALRLFENPGHGNDWLGVKLVGVKSNRAAIGARIAVKVRNAGGPPRSIYKTVGSGGSFGASPLQQHIGLGHDADIESVEVWWPASNTRQRFSNVAKNEVLEIREFSSADVKLERTPVRLGGGGRPQAAREYPVTGVVVSVDRVRKTFTASCESIPGFMPAMTMPLNVRDAGELDALKPGTAVEFTLVVDDHASHAERIRVRGADTAGRDPTAAQRLQLLDRIAASASDARPLGIGQAVPDFALTDQSGRRTALAQFAGKVVAVNFVYTRCVLPDYCLRLANNFSAIQKRFRSQLGKDLVLLTVTFDPTHDTPEVLTEYGKRWNADPAVWRFLTGPLADVRRVCRLFGVDAYADEGLLDHSLHTAIIGRDGRLAANLEGNQFTPEQLGDLLQAQLTHR